MKRNKVKIDEQTTIVNMNVEGMPGYKPRQDVNIDTYYSKSEMWAIMLGALKAGLLISLVFGTGLVLLVLFCLKVWFRV